MTQKDNDIMRILGNLEGTSKQILAEVQTHQDRMNRIDENVEGLEARLRSVEKKQYTIVIVAGAAWTIIVAWLTKWFS